MTLGSLDFVRFDAISFLCNLGLRGCIIWDTSLMQFNFTLLFAAPAVKAPENVEEMSVRFVDRFKALANNIKSFFVLTEEPREYFCVYTGYLFLKQAE